MRHHSKRRTARHQRRVRRHEFRRRAFRVALAAAKQQRVEGLNALAPRKRNPNRPKTRARRLSPPAHINLRTNFAETVGFLKDVRHLATSLNGRFFVDFTRIEDLTAAGALLLVAEFDRWRELIPQERLTPIELAKWNPSVRNRLAEMGFFDLLNSKHPVTRLDDGGSPADGERYLKFSSGHRSEGEKAKALREAIESLGPQLADRSSLFEGLTEAMTNVEHHAYKPDWKVKRWWMSASVDASGQRLRVMFVDHGVGIPATLPPDVIEAATKAAAVGSLGKKVLKPDARLIQAAVSHQRSKTMASNRGRGLKENIRGYIDRHEGVGSLRIISGYGQYVYKKETGQKSKIRLKALPVPFEGTFIEWIVEEYAARSSDEQHDPNC